MNAIEQAIADRESMTTKRREAETMNLAFDNTRGAQRIDEAMQTKIREEKNLRQVFVLLVKGEVIGVYATRVLAENRASEMKSAQQNAEAWWNSNPSITVHALHTEGK